MLNEIRLKSDNINWDFRTRLSGVVQEPQSQVPTAIPAATATATKRQ